MKKLIIILLILCIVWSLNADAESTSWYFKPSGNERPVCYGGSDLPDKYDCIYLGEDTKTVYLTFDAGYYNDNVGKILDVLKAHGAKAAFFVLPGIIKNNTEAVKRMAEDGHLICNHSYSHKNMGCIESYDSFIDEMTRLEEVCYQYTGVTMSKLFRPPEGAFSENLLKYCAKGGYTPVFWSFAYADWDNGNQPDAQKAKQKILSNLHNGEVMLLHPTSATNAAILDDVLTEIESRGYRYGTLDEFDSAEAAKLDTLREYQKQGKIFSGSNTSQKVIALSFDDGPDPYHTGQILDILDIYGVKATFFVIGCNAESNLDLLKREIDDGHEIGVHTYSHTAMSKLGKAKLKDEITRTAAIIESCGYTPTLFRAPGGELWFDGIDVANELGYTAVMWSWRLDTRDWAGVSADSIVNTVLGNLAGGDLPLFHDYNPKNGHTVEALQILIPRLMELGYQFVTVSELCAL